MYDIYIRVSDMYISVIAIVLTNAALGSSVSRNARTNEAIDNIPTTTTMFTWAGTAFVDIYNISIAT